MLAKKTQAGDRAGTEKNVIVSCGLAVLAGFSLGAP